MATKAKKRRKAGKAKKAVRKSKRVVRKSKPAAKRAAAPRAAGPSPKQMLLVTFRQEHARTMKVLNNFPANQGAFKPHERSNSATMLAWTFAVEQQACLGALKKDLRLTGGMPPAPATFGEAVTAFDRGARDLVQLLEKTPDSRLSETVQFFTGPKQMGDVKINDILWNLLMDQIHHRGQLSVYVRMAGGKVPSIYGPSADEPWT